MSTTIGATTSVLPATPCVAVANAASREGARRDQDGGSGASGGGSGKDNDHSAITPAPIQPLSNRMLAVFMQQDIELHGSMFG